MNINNRPPALEPHQVPPVPPEREGPLAAEAEPEPRVNHRNQINANLIEDDSDVEADGPAQNIAPNQNGADALLPRPGYLLALFLYFFASFLAK